MPGDKFTIFFYHRSPVPDVFLKIKVPLAFLNEFQPFFCCPAHHGIVDLPQVFPDGLCADLPGGGGCVILQKFFKRQDGVGLADVLDLAAFGQGHKPVAGTAAAVASRAETGDVSALADAAQHFVGAAVVFHLELPGIAAGTIAALGL